MKHKIHRNMYIYAAHFFFTALQQKAKKEKWQFNGGILKIR